jgi:hypothetical protein
MNKTILFTIIVSFLIIPFTYSYNLSSNSYTIDSIHSGLAGSFESESNYEFTSTTTDKQTSGSITSSNYIAESGWLDDVLVQVQSQTEPDDTTPFTSSGGSGGGPSLPIIIQKPINVSVDCYTNSDCKQNQYCYKNYCFDAECFDDSVCSADEQCFEYRCVKLFDIKILDFDSPVKLESYFEFTYLLKAMSNINADVTVEFFFENEDEIVALGKDTIYISSYEEKTESTKLFLPKIIKSGNYKFIVKLIHGKYIASANRIIEIRLKDDVAKIKLSPEKETKKLEKYILPILLGCSILILIIIFLIIELVKKPKKIKAIKSISVSKDKNKKYLPIKVHKELYYYIKKMINLGYSKHAIEEELIDHGWNKINVKKHMLKVLLDRKNEEKNKK